ncbi:exopolyphosphatase [Verrucomicrobia bacterium LW23]|nr:exopolyphosphatase [Verrucomicrobia bacterium LW23]
MSHANAQTPPAAPADLAASALPPEPSAAALLSAEPHAGDPIAAATPALGTRAAAFDIGSNSVKLLIGEALPPGAVTSGMPQGGEWKVVAEESIGTRLAEDLIHCGVLKQEAMDRTYDALARLLSIAEANGATRRAAVATSAVRDSSNRKAFLKRASEVLGCQVRLLSGDEEAETTYLGVASDPHWHPRGLFMTEIGGGSAQWVQGSTLGIEQKLSLPLGAVRLRERFIEHHPVGQEGLQRLLGTLHAQLQPALAYYTLGDRLFVGTGGVATTLAAIDLSLDTYDPSKTDHFVMTRHELASHLDRLSSLTMDQLRRVPGLPLKRTDLIIPGGAVLYVTMEIIGAHSVTASVRGLRYGLMRQLLGPVTTPDTAAQGAAP